MSQIKKFYNNGWKKFAETNEHAKAIPTSFKDVAGDTLNVEDVLANQQADIDKLKKNVAWLALHGGGGSGGGGVGGTTTARATILVDNLSTGATINLKENMDLPVVLNNIRPLTESPAWNVTISIGGSTILSTSMTYKSNSVTIPYDKLKKNVSSEQSKTLTVNATYSDDENAVSGSATWSGKIRIAAINLSCKNVKDGGELVLDKSEYDSYLQYSQDTTGNIQRCMCPSLNFSYSTPIISENNEDTFTFELTITNSSGKSKTLSRNDIIIDSEKEQTLDAFVCVIRDEDDKTLNCFEGIITNYFTTASDTYRIDAKITKNRENLTASLSFNFLLDDGNIHISTSDVSIDSLNPSLVTKDAPILQVPFIAHYNSAGVVTFTYRIRAYYQKDILGNYTENYTEIISNQIGNFGETIKPYCIFRNYAWIDDAVKNGDVIKLQIYVQSSEGGTKNATANVYFKLTEATESYITLSDNATKHLLVDFRADKYDNIEHCADMVLETNTYSAGSYNNLCVCTDLTFQRANNISGMNHMSDTNQPYLRISNGTYAKLENCRICRTDEHKVHGYQVKNNDGGSVQKEILPSTANLNDGWTISLCFKPDYHADDNRTIFMCGTVLNEKESDNGGQLVDGISVDVHGVYVGKKRVAVLTDKTINIVDIVYQKTSTKFKDQNNEEHEEVKWYLKIYVDGVLTVVQKDSYVNFDRSYCYIGGREWTDKLGNFNQSYLCDVNLYSLQIFDTPLNDLDILGMYINNKIVSGYTNGTPNYAFKNKELPSSFCKQIDSKFMSDGTTINPDYGKITSFIYGDNGFQITNLISGESVDSTSVGILIKNESTLQYAKSLGIPIIQLDISGDNGWTFDQFKKQLAQNEKLNQTSGDFYYWDPNSNNQDIIKIPGIKVSIQGQSSKSDFVKNLNIQMPSKNKTDRTFFTPKATWFPEDIYTLKADIVDSSHSNNAAIGKCINEVFGYDSANRRNNKFFPFNDTAVTNVYGKSNLEQCYRNKTQPTATLKHTVEGFPVFALIKFSYTQQAGSTQTFQTVPVGIYSFNIGRDAFHNLGIKRLNRVRRLNSDGSLMDQENMPEIKETEFPVYYEMCKYDEPETSDTYWVEIKDTNSVNNMKELVSGTTDFPTDLIETYEGDFWQPDASCLNKLYECRYPEGINVGDIKNFSVGENETLSLIEYVTKLPIETPYTTNSADDIVDEHCGGKYMMYKYDNTSSRSDRNDKGYYKAKDPDTDTQQYIEMTTNTNSFSLNQFKKRLNVANAQKYFCIAMLFGLIDNFGKNVSYRCWKGSEYYPDFYDLDTAFGSSNQGILNVSPACWIKYLNNTGNNTNKGNIYETYDTEKCYGHVSSNITTTDNGEELDETEHIISVIEAIHSKLWLSLDTKFMRDLSQKTSSIYSEYWFELRKYLDDYAKNYSSGTTSYDNFLDFFMDVYYKKQTGNCGTLLFNYDYRLKYLLIFTSLNDNNQRDVITNTSALAKLHGRKLDYTRAWLKEHILFLDSAFKWRAKKSDTNEYTTKFKNEINSVSSILVGNTPTYFPIKTNKTLVIYNDAQGSNGFVLAPKNVKTYIHAGGHTSGNTSDFKIQFDNIPSIIELGDSDIRLKDLQVKSFGYNSSGLGPIDVADGFSSLATLDFGQNTYFSSGFDIGCCTVGDYSELRKINFGETKGIDATYPLTLAMDDGSTKYRKITSIDIHNSRFITSITIPAVPLIYLDVTNSLITQFKLRDQYYLNDVSLDGCNRLTTIEIDNCNCFKNTISVDGRTNLVKLTISNCKNIKKLIINDCPSLRIVSIEKCESLESIQLNNCRALTGLDSKENYLQIYDNNNLKVLDLGSNSNLQKVKLTHGAIDKLTTLDINKTSIKSITGSYKKESQSEEERVNFSTMKYNTSDYTLYSADESTCNVLDLRGCTSLNSFNSQENQQLVCVLFRNEQNNPFNISTSFSGCSSLRRVFGHIKINCGSCFKSCKQFVLLNPNDTTWNGVNIKDGNGRIRTFWEMSAIRYDSGTANNTTANCENLIDTHAEDFTSDTTTEYFKNGDFVTDTSYDPVTKKYNLATNLTFGTSSYILSETFYDTSVNQVDTYYSLYRLALSQTSTGMGAGSTFRSNVSMFAWGEGTTKSPDNQPSRYTFYKIGNKITSFGWTFSNDPTHLYSPSYKKDANERLVNSDGTLVGNGSTGVLLDNGLFSHVPNITSIDNMFIGEFTHDNNLFKKSNGGTYPITTFYRWNCSVISDGESGKANNSHYDTNRDNYKKFEKYNSGFFAKRTDTDLTPSIISDDNILHCGNIETFFDGFQKSNNIETYVIFHNLWTFNANKCKLPKNILRLRSAFNGKYATGDFNPKTIFPSGSVCTTIVNSFNFTSTYSQYGSKAKFRIVPSMFDNVLGLEYFGGNDETDFLDTKSFYGSGINRLLCPDYSISGNILSWTYSWEELCNGKNDNSTGTTVHINGLFEKLTKLKYCNYFFENVNKLSIVINTNETLPEGIMYNGTLTGKNDKYEGAERIVATYDYDITFPYTLFKNNTELIKVHGFMYNCNFHYKLTSEGFSNCPNLTNVSYMCATTKQDGKTDLESGSYGIVDSCIPYKFFYHGQSEVTQPYMGIYKSVEPTVKPLSYGDYQEKLYNLYTKCLSYGKKLTIDEIFDNPSNILGTPDGSGKVTIKLLRGYTNVPSVWKDSSNNKLTKNVSNNGEWTIFRDTDGKAIGSIHSLCAEGTSTCTVVLDYDGNMDNPLTTPIEVTYTPGYVQSNYEEKTFNPKSIQEIYSENSSAASSDDIICLELTLMKYFDINYTITSGTQYNKYVKYYSFMKNNYYSSYCLESNEVTQTSMTTALGVCSITTGVISKLFADGYMKGSVFGDSDVILSAYTSETQLETVAAYILRLHNIGKTNWMSGIMDIKSIEWKYISYTKNELRYMSHCFQGNRFLNWYNGETVTEKNANYCPYNWSYNSSTDTWSTENMDTYQYDDSWSFNGDVEYDIENDTYGNYNPVNKYIDDIDAKSDNTSIKYGHVTVGGEAGLHYICPPDLFRYTKDSKDIDITYMFANCGPTWWTNAGSRTLSGRIPPNLLRPISNITNISGMFSNCKGIRCYNTKEGTVKVMYYIPQKFFQYAPNIITMNNTFHGCLINGPSDLSVFAYLNGGSALNIKGIFAGCYWNSIAGWKITGLFTSFNIGGIACAFSNKVYSLTTDEYGANIRTGADTYCTIPANITMSKNFNATRVHDNIGAQYVYGVYAGWPEAQVTEDGIYLGIGIKEIYHS